MKTSNPVSKVGTVPPSAGSKENIHGANKGTGFETNKGSHAINNDSMARLLSGA